MNGNRKKILIIDDEEEFCLAVRDFLNMRGYAAAFCTSPDAGIKTAKNTSPDLILLDVRMPGRDGLEVLGLLKKDLRTTSIPVVMVTAMTDNETRMKASSSYSEDYITKPVSYETLLAKVRAVLGGPDA